ncbi:hypothetical protein [Botrimarina sp.]|uniref:hypothetical protein n=1 Tax=Botrimarina sp. TaxID=2795802 RepID=UPI0032EBF0C5
MNQRSSFLRKVAYGVAIAVLLFPLSLLSAPATVDSPGGTLAQLKDENELSQADLGEIDPASETIKLATLGLRGLAVNLLWDRAVHFKKVEDWTNLTATLEQLAKLQPNFITFWKYQSWNLSYNVSVEFDDYRDRYYWVRRGIEFLEEGTEYNRDSPELLWELGWVLGQKIGRSDEKEQYRRLFKADDEYHPEDRPPRQRDNWLLSKDAHLEAIAAVDQRGKSLGKKSPNIFYASPAKSQMNYAEAIENEGLFERAVAAWRVAEDEWVDFGQTPIQHSTGPILRLGEEEQLEEKAAELREVLVGFAEDVESMLQEELRQQLTEEQREALDTPIGERTGDQMQLAFEAQELIKLTPTKIAEKIEQIDPSVAREAKQVAADLAETEKLLRFTRNYKDTTNYDYWKLRTVFEQTKEAVTAREKIFRAKRLFREQTDTEGAKELYEEAFEQWAQVFEKFPELKDPSGTTGDDVMYDIYDYKKVLEAGDYPFPDDFPLWEIIEYFDSEQEFATELKERAAGQGPSPTPADPADANLPPDPEAAAGTPEGGDSRVSPEPEADESQEDAS